MTDRHGCDEREVGHYTCHRVGEKLVVDGRLTEACWQKAPKSPRFVDMVTGVPGFLDTRMAALWDDENLYIAFWIEEPNVQAQLTERDSPVYFENDVELFIAGQDCYYEFEINARGTVYEVFYVWQDAYKRGGFSEKGEFDLLKHPVDVLGGFQDALRYKKHSRGRRWAFMDWDFPGLKTAVRIDGTLNNPVTVDRGWTVELAFPWSGMKTLAEGRSLPPRDGDVWRMDFSRFEALQYNGRMTDPSVGWSFNKHGVYDSHIPECFTFVHFSSEPV
ncbi:MAG: carbohydrate-binding family 9-like protein [Phycisphaerae bacterium]|nr:carbohydrate-binding family 9-like protein [Phycisphaerae bacterium]